MNETGLVQIYCGDGKGKTTAAIGAAVRAAGRGYRVLVARLLKTDDSGAVSYTHLDVYKRQEEDGTQDDLKGSQAS